MKLTTALLLFIGFFNAGWLCWVFVALFFNGAVLIPEPSKIVAGGEAIGTALIALAFIVKLFKLRERKS